MAENNFAAMTPAMAGVGKFTKSIGTTTKPTVVNAPHHQAAAQMASADKPDFISVIGHRQHLVAA